MTTQNLHSELSTLPFQQVFISTDKNTIEYNIAKIVLSLPDFPYNLPLLCSGIKCGTISSPLFK